MIQQKIRNLILKLALQQNLVQEDTSQPLVFSDDVMEMFTTPIMLPSQFDMCSSRVDEEIDRWLVETTSLRVADKKPETVFTFWRRQQHSGQYQYFRA